MDGKGYFKIETLNFEHNTTHPSHHVASLISDLSSSRAMSLTRWSNNNNSKEVTLANSNSYLLAMYLFLFLKTAVNEHN